MQLASRKFITCEHSKTSVPQITVKPGEVFRAETQLCSGDWLNDADDMWTPEKHIGPNPTVVVAVEGAMPGGSLRVHIHDIEPAPLGYTGFVHRENDLANMIIDRDWGDNMRIVRIADGFVEFAPGTRFAARPMIGTLGTAPAGEAIDNARGGRHGGNMDTQEVCAGATVTLPVEAPGALLHIGDVHAIQGDGEICSAGGIECRSVVTLSAEPVARPAQSQCVRIEDATHISAVACEGSLDECCVAAIRELLFWLSGEYGFDEKDAYLLLGQVMQIRVPQLVNPTRSVIAKIAKTHIA